MDGISNNNRRIAKNALMLYVRMFLNLSMTLYTSRIVLKYLGVEDYGIYNIVGGLVSMFSLISGALSNSVSRFLTFELGKGNSENLKKTFSVSVSIHIALALIIFIATEVIGVWFLNNRMNISPNRIYAANWVLQFSLLTFLINLMSIPYNAAIVAHERMKAFAYVGVLEVTLKLVVAYLIVIISCDKLIVYSILLFLTSLLIRSIYGIYCKRFQECKYTFIWDRNIVITMSQFAGWNFLGTLVNLFKSQGVNILINIYLGVALNAAQGLATQINNAVQAFVDNFMMAINPQIIKDYARNEKNKSLKMVKVASRLSFFLMLIIAFPIINETALILDLWLDDYPKITIIFVQLILIYTLIETLSKPLITMINATGRIKYYQIGISCILILNFPLSYIALAIGYAPESIYFIYIFIGFISLLFRIHILSRLCQLRFLKFTLSILWQPLLISTIAVVVGYLLTNISEWFMRVLFTFVGGTFILLITIFYIGLTKHEREIVKFSIRNIVKK